MMRCTEFYRIKEQLDIVENSMLRLKKLLRFGTNKAIEFEAACLKFNYCILLHIKKNFMNSLFEIKIYTLEEEARELLQETYSSLDKQSMEVRKNGKTKKSI